MKSVLEVHVETEVFTMNLSTFDDYRELIKSLFKDEGLSYRQVCEKTNIHSSYFSRVMSDKADFSQEQLYLIGKACKLSGWELDFLLLLGERDSSSLKNHSEYVDKKIKKIRNEKQKVLTNLKNITHTMSEQEKEEYYRTPLTALVLMYLTIEKFRKKPKLISKSLHLEHQIIEIQIRKLMNLNLIEEKRGQIKIIKSSIHIDESDKMHLPNLVNWRLESINYLQRGQKKDSDWQFSTLFSTTLEKKKKIKALFKKFVVEAQSIVGPEPSTADVEVYHMNFDLY